MISEGRFFIGTREDPTSLVTLKAKTESRVNMRNTVLPWSRINIRNKTST